MSEESQTALRRRRVKAEAGGQAPSKKALMARSKEFPLHIDEFNITLVPHTWQAIPTVTDWLQAQVDAGYIEVSEE